MEAGSQIDFSDLVTNIPVGVCRILLDNNFTLIYGNRFLYSIYGYTPEQLELELNNCLAAAILPEELTAVTTTVGINDTNEGNGFRIEHRIRRRDGLVIWLLVSGNYVTHSGSPAANCIIVDITDRKLMEEKLRIDEERFRLTFIQTDNTIFDYDIASRVMIHSVKSANAYGLNHETHDVPNSLVENCTIHPESAEDYLEMYREIREGAKSASCVIRAKLVEGGYAWRRITMSTIFDLDGKAIKAVGLLENIDSQVRREEVLKEQSQRDALTGLYNKGTTESMICDIVKAGNSPGALLIVDIDNFKGVNDNYGHPFGDIVLSESAHRVASLCRCNDIIGRIGGDEILLYLDGVIDPKAVGKRADEICAVFHKEFVSDGISAKVACTVGASMFPRDANTFTELYQKADAALYTAKRDGRNRSYVFDECM